MLTYEINEDTLAVLPFSENKSRVVEKKDEYIIDATPQEIMENSCEYYGSSFEGRILGSKNILGSIYKSPIIVEEKNKLIFFPTEAIASEKAGWISYKNIKNIEKFKKRAKVVFDEDKKIIINCPYFSIKNQIFRCNILEAISENRKNKKND